MIPCISPPPAAQKDAGIGKSRCQIALRTHSFAADPLQGRFLELTPYERIVEAIDFESSNPGLAGVMTIMPAFTQTSEGTEVTIVCANLPPAIRPEDIELGCRLSLQNLARLVE